MINMNMIHCSTSTEITKEDLTSSIKKDLVEFDSTSKLTKLLSSYDNKIAETLVAAGTAAATATKIGFYRYKHTFKMETNGNLTITRTTTGIFTDNSFQVELKDVTTNGSEITYTRPTQTFTIKKATLDNADVKKANLAIREDAAYLLTIKDTISAFTEAGISFLVTPDNLVALDKDVKGANLIISGIAGFDTAVEGNEEEKKKKYADLNNAINNNKITVITDTISPLKDGKTLTKVDKFDGKTGICIQTTLTTNEGTITTTTKYIIDMGQICEILKLDPKEISIGWSLSTWGLIALGTLAIVFVGLYFARLPPFAPKDSNEEATNAIVAVKDSVTTNVLVPAKEVVKAVVTEISAAAA